MEGGTYFSTTAGLVMCRSVLMAEQKRSISGAPHFTMFGRSSAGVLGVSSGRGSGA